MVPEHPRVFVHGFALGRGELFSSLGIVMERPEEPKSIVSRHETTDGGSSGSSRLGPCRSIVLDARCLLGLGRVWTSRRTAMRSRKSSITTLRKSGPAPHINPTAPGILALATKPTGVLQRADKICVTLRDTTGYLCGGQ
jgi:hypothetical protein